MKGTSAWSQPLHTPEFLSTLKQQHAAANAGKEGQSLLGVYALAHSSLQALSLLAVLGSLHQDCAEASVMNAHSYASHIQVLR